MAQIVSSHLSKAPKERNSVHEVVRATFTSFLTADGTQYFQIDTFGTTGRAHPEKISQSIQFDAETARAMVKIL